MRNPTVRLLLIIGLFLGIGLGSAWIYLRQKGYTEPISPVRSPFFDKFGNEEFFVIAYGGNSKSLPANSVAAFEAAASLHPKLILWVDVVMTSDEQVIASTERAITTEKGSTLVSMQKLGDLPALANGEKHPLLKTLLEKFPSHRFIINVRDYRPGLDGKLASVVESVAADERVLLQSDQDGILRDMRSLRPQWIFGTSQAQITQLLMLVPFGLESVAPLKGDVYISEATRGESTLINEAVVSELHRRGRKVFAGPISPKDNVHELQKLGVDGIISGDPEAFVGFVR